MRQFDIDCRLEYDVQSATHFLFQIHTATVDGQVLTAESLEVTPPRPIRPYADSGYGNRYFRLDAEPGPLALRYRARIGRAAPLPANVPLEEVPVSRLPDDVMHLVTPTRYCESDILGKAALQLFGDLPQGRSRVEAITRWIHDNIDYQIGSSDTTTTARDVFVQRSGVCRDFAHLGITFCRALGIPARFVVGYVKFDEPPPDFHAIFEAYLGGQWVQFDATGLAPVDRLIRIGTGRDAKDVPFATMYGRAVLTSLQPEIEELVMEELAA